MREEITACLGPCGPALSHYYFGVSATFFTAGRRLITGCTPLAVQHSAAFR